jgi:hypothetical protein
LLTELLEQRGDFLIGRTRIDDHEDFVRSQCSLTSLELDRADRVKRLTVSNIHVGCKVNADK